MRISPNALLICLTVVAACGGGDNTGPTAKQKLVIPEQLYQVDFNASTNDCNATNLDAFKGLVLTKAGGTSLLGLDTVPIPATVTDTDRVTFSDPIHLQGDTVVTFAGDWTFAEDRHTFMGSVTFAASFGGPVVCTFTSATTGQHSTTPAAVPTAPTGAPNGRITRPEHSGAIGLASAEPARWGNTAQVIFYGVGGACFTVTANGSSSTSVSPSEVFASARDSRAGQEEDIVAWHWQLYGFSDEATADLSLLNATLGSFDRTGLVKESDWFWHYEFDPKPFLAAPQDWFSFVEGGAPFSQSGQNAQAVQSGYWFIVIDVYWYDREGLGYGWYRNVPAGICHAP